MADFIAAVPKLANLLAGENINIVHAAMGTAAFDPKTRTLYLPVFKGDVKQSVYTMLVAHEVGHALYTPVDGFDIAAREAPECPKHYVNCVEDVRIERLVRKEYPGLYSTFIAAYQQLLDDDFFGIGDDDVTEYGFMNRLNLHAKCGPLLPQLTFTEDEQVLVDMCFAAETFADVIEISKLLKEHTDKEEEPEPEDGEGAPGDGEGDESGDSKSESGDGEGDESGESGGQSDADGESGESNGMGDPSEGESGEGSDNQSPGSPPAKSAPGDDKGAAPKKAKPSPPKTGRAANDDMGTEKHAKQVEEKMTYGTDVRILSIRHEDVDRIVTEPRNVPEDGYQDFITTYRPFIQRMVNEFEIRKAAHANLLSSEAKTGVLDCGKLTEYKFNDDIFKRYGIVPAQQNHGVMLFIDNSGSMQGVEQKSVFRQATIMAEFCRRTKIPFVVYSWTSGGYGSQRQDARSTTVNFTGTTLNAIVDSTMNAKKYRSQIAFMNAVINGENSLPMCGTPLAETKMAAVSLGHRFKAQHGIEKLHIMILSDGAGSGNVATLESSNPQTGEAQAGYNRRWAYDTYRIEVESRPAVIIENQTQVDDETAIDQYLSNMCSSYLGYYVGSNQCSSGFDEVGPKDMNSGHRYDRMIYISHDLQQRMAGFTASADTITTDQNTRSVLKNLCTHIARIVS